MNSVSSRQSRRPLLALAAALASLAGAAPAMDATAAGAAAVAAKEYALGIEWPITGDDNHDARVAVSYRVAGAAAWSQATGLVREQFNGANMLAGSVTGLRPDTAYDLRLDLSDPQGGSTSTTLSARTRALPVRPAGRMLHVRPGAGGGNGSSTTPFLGIAAADAAAQPGDTLLLHVGDYGPGNWISTSGRADARIAWRPAGDGEVTVHRLDIGGSWTWIEGLTSRNAVPYGFVGQNGAVDVVVTGCSFLGDHYAIWLAGGGSFSADWFISDNTIVGDQDPASGSLDGEGVELNGTDGHTVMNNSISRCADGISDPRRNVDIIGNDIFDCSDDGVETDLALRNVRVCGNRIRNILHNIFSFQPQNGGPTYYWRNAIFGFSEGWAKFRTTDRFVFVHNTVVNWNQTSTDTNPGDLLHGIVENNLFISYNGGRIYDLYTGNAIDWRTVLDYNGFDPHGAGVAFKWGGADCSTISQFTAACGLEAHGVMLTRAATFDALVMNGPPPTAVPAQHPTLRAGSPAIDRGVVLGDLSGAYTGAAPDLGAYESGWPLPVYGPRAGGLTVVVDPPQPPPLPQPQPQPPTVVRAPYAGAARALPGTIQSEDFDEGGEGIAYHDLDATNNGGGYRTGGVDIRACSDSGGGWQVGWFGAGEWLEYTVSVATAGSYDIAARVANGSSGGAIHVAVDGVDATGAMTFASTGGWDTWLTVTRRGATLAAGSHILRVACDAGALDFNWLAVTPTPATRSPYGGIARAIPGTIQTEDFDNGGEGVAFHDLDAVNNGGGYRTGAVDIRACSDTGGGWQVGWFGPGEWLEYTVAVASAGSYDLAVRVANGSSGGSIRVSIDGVDATGALAFANTGGWDTWTSLAKPAIALAAGSHVVRLACVSGALDCNWLAFTAPKPVVTGVVSGQWYKLVAKHSGKLLAVAGSGTADAANIWQWGDDGSTGQQWRIDAFGDGSYTLTARCSGKALEVAGWSTADGGDIQQWTLHSGANQRWRIDDTGGGWYRLTNVNSGKVLDVSGISTSDGADLHQWAWWNGDNQKWQLVPVAPTGTAANERRMAPDAQAGDAASGPRVSVREGRSPDRAAWFPRQDSNLN